MRDIFQLTSEADVLRTELAALEGMVVPFDLQSCYSNIISLKDCGAEHVELPHP